MAIVIGGPGVTLPPPAFLYPTQAGYPGVPQAIGTNYIDLLACSAVLIPSGTFMVWPGLYGKIQILDPVTQIWRQFPTPRGVPAFIRSDGVNYRVANLTGGAIGAVVTTAGSAYTTVPTVTASSGGSTWQAIVGGAVNSSVTITTAGAGYGRAPLIQVSAPPAGGVQATATCTISAGAVNAVTMTNQGAGYNIAPTFTVIPNPLDPATPTTTAVLTPTLTGSGTVTAVLCTNPGNPLTTVPTLTFSSGAAAATVIMDLTITGITVGAGGTGYGTSLPFQVVTFGTVTAGSSVLTNPGIQTGLMETRQATIWGTSSAGGAVDATGLVIVDGGEFQAVPLLAIGAQGGVPTVVGTATATVGSVSQRVFIQPL